MMDFKGSAERNGNWGRSEGYVQVSYYSESLYLSDLVYGPN